MIELIYFIKRNLEKKNNGKVSSKLWERKKNSLIFFI